MAHRQAGNRRIRPSMFRVSATEDFGLFLLPALTLLIVFEGLVVPWEGDSIDQSHDGAFESLFIP